MSSSGVEVHELIGWGLDDYSFRNSSSELDIASRDRHASQQLSQEPSCKASTALVDTPPRAEELFRSSMQRTDLHREYADLDWTLGIIDLRQLLAFQRRLVFDSEIQQRPTPSQDHWPELFSLCLGGKREIEHSLQRVISNDSSSEFTIQSSNPDLQLRLSPDIDSCNCFPFSLYGGSPFLEVAEFRQRWLLRDGYHRAYHLLKAEVHHVPAVVIRARTIEEVGAVQPWFFGEEVLFSARPPRVTDFLCPELVLRYKRQRFRKSIHIRIEESFEPVHEPSDHSGDTL